MTCVEDQETLISPNLSTYIIQGSEWLPLSSTWHLGPLLGVIV